MSAAPRDSGLFVPFICVVSLCTTCSSATVGRPGQTDGGTTDVDSDNDADGDTDTDSDVDCTLDVSETFDDGTLPSGWAVDNYDSDSYGYDWTWDDTDNTTGGDGGYWWIDGEFPVSFDDAIISGTYTPGGCSIVKLSFSQDFVKNGSDDFGFVQIKVDDGEWETLATILSSQSGAATPIDITDYLPSPDSQFRIRFRYAGQDDKTWKMDDFKIVGTP
jgi:hypothetical protein